jgi:hypothetical protein
MHILACKITKKIAHVQIYVRFFFVYLLPCEWSEKAMRPMPAVRIIDVDRIRLDTICLYTICRRLRWQHRQRRIPLRKTHAGPQQSDQKKKQFLPHDIHFLSISG